MKLQRVSAGSGGQWMRRGISMFWRQPIALCGLFFMFFGAMIVISLIPLVGGMMALVLFPCGSLGLMIATREAIEGRFPRPKLLWMGLLASPRIRQYILTLGVFYTIGFMALLGLSALADGGEFAQLYLLGGKMDVEALEQPGFQTAVWLAMLLYLPLSALFWHAPALAYWHQVPPIKSLFFSFAACWVNWRAMLVYALCWTALYTGAGMALVLVATFMGESETVGMLLVPLVLLLTAMFFCASYFSYHDSFEQTQT